ncbi:MAG: LCP family protein, partial [Oscillospiraceae bacterium]|nr:LCP family protein [Oscillospiraceae bacterium]
RPTPTLAPEELPPDLPPIDVEEAGIFTILIAGQDNIGEYGLSDTIMLVAVDIGNSRVNVLNIPRDTRADLPWAMPKINSVMNMTGSIDRLMEEVEGIAGFMPNNYVVIDMDAFSALVDVVGGVYFDVPRRMVYDDPCQDLHINLEQGYQHLDGERALHLIRWRQNNAGTAGYADGDIGRIATQQDFMRVLAAELLQIRNVPRIHEIVQIFIEYVETDLSFGNLAWFATRLMYIESEDITFHTIPSRLDYVNGTSYVIIELEPWLEMVNAYFNPFPMVPVIEENVRIFTWSTNGVFEVVGEGLSLSRPYE